MALNLAKSKLTHLSAIVIALCVTALAVPTASSAATYMVSKTVDTNDGVCDADCSLREAIVAANAGSSVDVIVFSGALAVTLDDPLPPVDYPLAINAGVTAATVSGSAGYVATYCVGSDYALDLTDVDAVGSTVYNLPFYSLCDRAIKSPVQVPTLSVGPRRADGTLPIGGVSPGGDRVDLYFADGPTTGAHEADDYLQTVTATAGVYGFVPGVEPVPGQKLTATSSGLTGTSDFAQRVTVPDDIVSPVFAGAVAVGNARVRLDFSEPIAAGSVAPAGFSLSVGNLARPIIAATPSGNSIFLDTNLPWNPGEAGNFLTTDAVRITDYSGNELIGQAASTVLAGPGELEAPVIGSMRFSSNRVCQSVTARCKRGKTFVLISLNKPARVIFNVLRGTVRKKPMVTFVKRLDAGRNRVSFTATVSGKKLPAIGMTLRATAQDVARSLSSPVETPFRVVTNKRDL